MPVYAFEEWQPTVSPSTWVAPSAQLIGQVQLEAESSVWFNAVLRADMDLIRIGPRSNVQDGAVLHTDTGLQLLIGQEVVVGHQAMLHGCTVGNNTLIGIQAVVMNGARIGANSILAAGSLVPEGKSYPDGVLLMGSPAKVVRELDDTALAFLQKAAGNYVRYAARHRQSLRRLDSDSRIPHTGEG